MIKSLILFSSAYAKSAEEIVNDMEAIEAQLTRVLGFFPRVDTKATALFTMNSAILTVSALNLKPDDLHVWYVGLPATATVIALLISYYFLYRCNYPDINGGEGSLVHFAEVQKRTELHYFEQFSACTDEAYQKDLIGQIWRNSQILCGKYKDVSAALKWTALTLVPFTALLIATAISHASIPVIKT